MYINTAKTSVRLSKGTRVKMIYTPEWMLQEKKLGLP